VAEYSYTRRSTSTTRDADVSSSTRSDSTTYHFVVVVVRLPRPGPSMAVESRHALSRLGRALFGDRPTAIGNEEFDRAFRIDAEDPAAARRLVGPALAAEHVAGAVPSWSLHGNELLTYESGRLDGPDSAPGRAAPLIRVAQLLGR
jgi:hypothetical protein